MNMKKTMAAIAAGAVAVSAMATTVSALEARTLTYNLVQTIKDGADAEVKLTAKFYNVPLDDGETATFGIKNLNDNDIVRISGVYIEEGKQIVPIVATKDQSQSGVYSPATAAMMTTGTNGTIAVPIVATNTTNGVALMGGTAGTAGTTAVEAVTEEATATGASIANGGTAVSTVAGLGTHTITGPVDEDGNGTVADGAVTLTYDGTAHKWYSDAGKTKEWTVSGTGIDALTLADGDTITIGAYKSPVAAVAGVEAVPANEVHANITVEITKKKLGSITGTTHDITEKIDNVNAELGLTLGASLVTTGDNAYTSTAVDITASDFSNTPNVYQYPYKSSLNNYLYTSTSGIDISLTDGAHGGDVLSHVYEVKTDDNSTQINPVSIRAVINDAIQNYNDVTFVFNTAAKPVVISRSGAWINVANPVGSYTDNAWDGSSDNVGDFTSFGNHFFNSNQAGYDPNTQYILKDWLGDNLFNGALLINSNLTLSLADTDKFDWTSTSLSFSWDAIQDTALTTNQYANYVQNMVLRTSADWYWDNFQVVLGETETEEVDLGAPVEADDTDLEEEEVDDLGDFEEEESEEEPADESEEEPVVEEAPAVVNNPSTGNASVALAVIPVALAAAAIVAKKRG